MTTYQILYWHDIPLQVRAQSGRTRASRPLSERFQEAVDRASMAAGLTGTDVYLELLNWGQPQETDALPDDVVADIVDRLEKEFETIPWRETAADLRQRYRDKHDG